MKAITLRNLPPELARTIQRKAKEQRTSLNKAVIKLLEERTAIPDKSGGKKRLYRDLDSLAGSWSQEEAKEFDKSLESQRAIDPELWK